MNFSRLSTFRNICAAPLVAWILVGCQTTPPPPKPFVAPPASAVQVTHYMGTPLSGPTLDKPVKFQPDDAFDVNVEFIGLEKMTPLVGQPLAGRARMVVETRRDYPTMPTERLLRGVRWLDLKDQTALAGAISPAAGRTLEIASPRGALPANVTAAFTLTDSIGLEDPASATAIHRQIELDVYRDANNRLEAGVVMADLVDQVPEKTDLDEGANKEEKKPTTAPSSGTSKAAKPSKALKVKPAVPMPPPIFMRELAIIDLPPVSAGGERAAVIIPIHFSGSDTTAIALVLTLMPAAATPDHIAAASRCADDLQRSSDALANSPRQLTVVSPQWSRYRVALDALTQPDRRRAALVYLATQTEAPLCRDVALAADGPTLDHLSADVRRAVASPGEGVPPSGEELGWTLDRTTFKMIAAMMNDAKLPLELAAIITDYAGQPGRDAGSMDEISHSLATRTQFNTRLEAENLIALEDSSLTARVRAYDWLAARGEAPSGYDPQGNRKDRRKALENFTASSAAAPSKAAPATAPAGAAK